MHINTESNVHYFFSYDTIGAHLLRKEVAGGDTSEHNKLHSDTSDSGDPRVMSWMEDLQLATNKLETRIASLEQLQKNTVELTEMKQCVDHFRTQVQCMLFLNYHKCST